MPKDRPHAAMAIGKARCRIREQETSPEAKNANFVLKTLHFKTLCVTLACNIPEGRSDQLSGPLFKKEKKLLDI